MIIFEVLLQFFIATPCSTKKGFIVEGENGLLQVVAKYMVNYL